MEPNESVCQIVPNHTYTRRFDIFYNSENVGYCENEELTPNAKSEWVIHIPSEKRAYLEAKQKGLYAAIFDLPNEADGDIDKKYYIEPVAFTRIVGKDYNNKAYQIDANGPGAYVGLKFNNKFFNLDTTEIAVGTNQLNITIDLKKFANELKYSLAEVAGSLPTGVVTEPQGISIKNCFEFPSMIVATDPSVRPTWVKTEDITVGKAASAANADLLGFKKPEDYVTYENINTDIGSYFDNSYEYGFRTGYDMDKNLSYVYTKSYKVHLLGDVSGEAEVSNFNDIDIECKVASKGSEVFDADPNCTYNDGVLVGICEDGLVRPFINDTEIIPVEYIGVVSKDEKNIKDPLIGRKDKVRVQVFGKKFCLVEGTDITPGRRVVVDSETGKFKLWDKVFDSEYNGIVIKVEEVNDEDCLCQILLK